MSVNRRRRNKGATKRAYLNSVQNPARAGYDKRPDDLVKDVLGHNRDLTVPIPNHGRATTTYEVLVENDQGGIDIVTRKTPASPEPEVKARKAMHLAMRGIPTVYRYKLVDTAFRKLWLIYQVLGTRKVFWFEWFDPMTQLKRESITYATKESALKRKELNTIEWK